ncbi:MAG: hypothetical protein SGILL_009994, partial [Bacillariaceae sp.]
DAKIMALEAQFKALKEKHTKRKSEATGGGSKDEKKSHPEAKKPKKPNAPADT